MSFPLPTELVAWWQHHLSPQEGTKGPGFNRSNVLSLLALLIPRMRIPGIPLFLRLIGDGKQPLPLFETL